MSEDIEEDYLLAFLVMDEFCSVRNAIVKMENLTDKQLAAFKVIWAFKIDTT